MLTSKGFEIDRVKTHTPIEFYAKTLSGNAVSTRIEKSNRECVSFICEEKEYVYPSECKFDIVFERLDGSKAYGRMTLGKLFDSLKNSLLFPRCYVLNAAGVEVPIDLMEKGNKEINWPTAKFEFVDGEFAILY